MFDFSMNLEEFKCKSSVSHIHFRKISLRYLHVFSDNILGKQGFSNLLVIKNKQENRFYEVTTCVQLRATVSTLEFQNTSKKVKFKIHMKKSQIMH